MKVVVIGLSMLLVSLLDTEALSASCASAKAAGSGDCSKFSGSIDVSQCGESFSEPTVVCSGETATVKVHGTKMVYTAQFILGQPRYGDRKWQLANPVTASQNSAVQGSAAPKKKVAAAPKAISKTGLVASAAIVKTPVTPGLGTVAPSSGPVLLAQNVSPQPIAELAPAESASEKSFQFDYDVSISVSDNKFDEQTGQEAPESTTAFGQTAYLGFNGHAEDVKFTVYANLMGAGPGILSSLEVATASKEFGKVFALTVGRNYLNVGGWENKNWIFSSIFVSPYIEGLLPFSDMNNGTSATMMQGDLKLGKAGVFSLQVTDDVVADESEGSWKYFNQISRQPVAIVEWSATFGPVTPLLQFSSYDLNHSAHTSVGAKIEVGGLTAFLDYTTDSRAFRTVEGKEEKYVFTNIAADLAYATRVVTPFVKYTVFDVKQPITDLKANTDQQTFDDNAQVWTIGTNFNTVSPYFAPYIAYLSRSADVYKDPAIEVDAVEMKSGSSIVVGFGGSI